MVSRRRVRRPKITFTCSTARCVPPSALSVSHPVSFTGDPRTSDNAAPSMIAGCLVENYQTPEVCCLPKMFQLVDSRGLTAATWPVVFYQGLNIPEVLQPYMQGRKFLPWIKSVSFAIWLV